MPDPLRPLRLNAVELLRQPGATRHVAARIGAADLGVEHRSLDGDVDVEIELVTLDDRIAVAGTASAPWTSPCRRCLRGLSGVAVVEVDEQHQIEVTDPDAFAIENGQLDLVPTVRESVLLELDDERLCREDCAGLCPICGSDRNEDACGCDTGVTDERWAVLDQLVLDDE